MKKRILSFILALCLIWSMMPGMASAVEVVASGTCGDNMTWELEDGVLTISGSGKMDENDLSWRDYSSTITTVIVEEGVTSIAKRAFSSYPNISYIQIPASVTNIGQYAFDSCPIKHIFYGGTAEQWDAIPVDTHGESGWYSAKRHNQAKADVNITESCTCELAYCNICDSYFSAKEIDSDHNFLNGICSVCGLAEYIHYAIDENANATVTGADDGVTSIVIPGVIEGCPVTVDHWSFTGNGSLESVILEEGITEIGIDAFANCGKLTSVSIPSSVTKIWEGAFEECNSLYWVDVSDIGAWCNIEFGSWINTNPLQYAEKLYVNGELTTDLVIPEGVESIAPYAFHYFVGLESVTIPESVSSIGENAFYDCENIKKVQILGDNTVLDEGAFSFCTSLTQINAEQGLGNIGSSAFSNCWELKNVPLSDHCTYIGSSAFFRCDNLTSLVIPDGVTQINELGTNFVYVSFGKSVTKILDDAFSSVNHVLYRGSEADWQSILIYSGNDVLNRTVVHYNCTGTEITTTATCLEQVWTCSLCAEPFHTEQNYSGKHEYTAAITAPTCTQQGYTTYTCHCGDSYKDDFTDAIGHEYGDWIVEKAPTEEQEGIRSRTCLNCGEKEEEVISRLDTADPVKNPFRDVKESDYFYDPVMWAVSNDITSGMSATEFGPKRPCTRGHIVTFLWRAAGEPEPTTTVNPFRDVPESAFYYKAVLWAVENGITTGMKEGEFWPNYTCNRAQAVTFLYRAAGEPEIQSNANPFSDVKGDAYYRNAVLWAVENNVTNGMGNGKFEPNYTCTRGQIVTFLYRSFSK